MKSFKKPIIFLTLTMLSVMPVFASAALGIPCGTTGTPRMCDFNDIFVLINNIIRFILVDLVLPFSVLLIAYAGWLFMTSGSSEEKRTNAKKIFKNLVIGIAMILCSWLAVYLLFTAFGYSTKDGRAGLSDKALDWRVNSVPDVNTTTNNSTNTTVNNTNNNTNTNTTVKTHYDASLIPNVSNPATSKFTVRIIPVATSRVLVRIICTDNITKAVIKGENTIPTSSDTTTIDFKLNKATDYSCIVENDDKNISLKDPTDGEIITQ